MADGIAILGDIIKYHYYCLFRLMLLPFNSIGRCYGQWIVADDHATEADVVAYCILI